MGQDPSRNPWAPPGPQHPGSGPVPPGGPPAPPRPMPQWSGQQGAYPQGAYPPAVQQSRTAPDRPPVARVVAPPAPDRLGAIARGASALSSVTGTAWLALAGVPLVAAGVRAALGQLPAGEGAAIGEGLLSLLPLPLLLWVGLRRARTGAWAAYAVVIGLALLLALAISGILGAGPTDPWQLSGGAFIALSTLAWVAAVESRRRDHRAGRFGAPAP